MPDVSPVEAARQIHTQDLIDYKDQGGQSRMREAKAFPEILVKEMPVRTADDLFSAVNEGYMGGALKGLRYVRGPEIYKTAGNSVNGDLRIQFFIKKVEGKPPVIPNTPDGVIEFGREMSTKLAEVADHDVVLGDFKPENIINDGRENILIDLGTSVRTGVRPKGCTFEYSSPDVFDADGIDSRHDVYTLASTMSEALLGTTPNEMYGGFVALAKGLSPQEKQQKYQEISEQLKRKCHPNTKLAEVLSRGLSPDKKVRPSIREFAKLMEEISPRFRAFPTISEKEINEIQDVRQAGALLSNMLDGMMGRESGKPLEQQRGPYFENTNFARIGKIAELIEHPSSSSYGFGDSIDARRVDILNHLRRDFQNNVTPYFFKKTPYEADRPMTDLERESVQFILTLYNLADRFPGLKYGLSNQTDEGNRRIYQERAAYFVNDCLNLMRSRDNFAGSIRLHNPVWTQIDTDLLAGFDARQKASGIAQSPRPSH